MSKIKHIIHQHYTGDTAPTSDNLLTGEVAVGLKAGDEKLFIKNSNNQIVKFADKKVEMNPKMSANTDYWLLGHDDTGKTTPFADTVYQSQGGVSIKNGKLYAQSGGVQYVHEGMLSAGTNVSIDKKTDEYGNKTLTINTTATDEKVHMKTVSWSTVDSDKSFYFLITNNTADTTDEAYMTMGAGAYVREGFCIQNKELINKFVEKAYLHQGSVSSSTEYLTVSDSKNGIVISGTNELSETVGQKHTHANKELLDTYKQTEENLADAVAKKHEHINMDVLTGISVEKVAAWDAASNCNGTVTSVKVEGVSGLTGSGTVTSSGTIQIGHETYTISEKNTNNPALDFGGTFNIREMEYNNYGHITGVSVYTYNIPSIPESYRQEKHFIESTDVKNNLYFLGSEKESDITGNTNYYKLNTFYYNKENSNLITPQITCSSLISQSDIHSTETISGNTIMSTRGFYQTSDERLKTFGNNIDVDLEKLSKLRKAYFSFNKACENTHIGVSAQEIQEIYPEIVSEKEDGYLTVDYSKLSVIALSAVDKLYKQNKMLEERLKRIEDAISL